MLQLELFHAFILVQLPSYILSDFFLIKTNSAYTVPFCPKVSAPVSFLERKVFIKHFDSTCALQKPTTSDTANLGVIDRITCMWSSWIFISIISRLFHSQSSCMMSLTDFSPAPLRILNLYLGHHTIWYLHCQIACANLL
jgi:hypothetical protein